MSPIPKGIVLDGLYVDKAGVPLCPVTGATIPKGKEVGKATYHGVEYHFCCGGCPDDFKAEPAKYAVK
jgi:YHS domain-containing protein